MSKLRALSGLLASAVLLSACALGGGSQPDHADAKSTDYFGYMVASRLVTSNAGTAFGAASNAQVLSGRLYPSAFVPGPEGQIIPNSDLITAVEEPMTELGQRQIVFSISPKATYSDGVPVSCEDYLLAYTAGSMPAVFGSHLPLLAEVDDMHCDLGNKNFRVILKPGRGDRWRYMFGPGIVMPSHSIARKLGMNQEEFVDALRSWDPERLAEIAHMWRYGFMLGEFDPELQVSYGPFVIESVGESGEVVLKRNDTYYGEPSELERVVVWPNSTDVTHLLEHGSLKVADSTGGIPSWLDRNAENNPYDVKSQVGEQTDTLLLSEAGLFTDVAQRQAFSACVDQEAMAKASSSVSGLDVPAMYIHSLRHDDPIGKQLDFITHPRKAVDPVAAGALNGQVVRVGYLGPDPRYAAMVKALKDSCAAMGITVEDASAEYMSATYLEPDPANGIPGIDAFLVAVDPMSEYAVPDARIAQVDALKRAEEELWNQVVSIPVAAQPRTFVFDRKAQGVVPYTGLSGIGWNMDRWSSPDYPSNLSTTPSA